MPEYWLHKNVNNIHRIYKFDNVRSFLARGDGETLQYKHKGLFQPARSSQGYKDTR